MLRKATKRAPGRRCLLAIAGVLCAVLLALPAAAQPGGRAQAARQKATDATAAYNLGQYEEAAQLYEQAYRLRQDPGLLFNIGQSYRLADQRQKALTAYRAYLRTVGADDPNRAQAQRRVRELEEAAAAAAAAKTSSPSPVEATVRPVPGDDRAGAARTPPEPLLAARSLPLDPPASIVSGPERRDDEVAPKGGRRWWPWAALGGAVVLVGTTVALVAASGSQPTLPRTALGHQDLFR